MSVNGSGLATAARSERRYSARRKAESLVYLMIAPGNGGILHDLNENGMCVSVANPLGADTECHFSIVLHKHAPVRGVARVAWLSESGKVAGLRFVEMPDDSRQQIRQWLTPGAPELVTGQSRIDAAAAEAEAAETAPPASQETQLFPEAEKATTARGQTPLFFLPQARTEDEPGNGTEAWATEELPPAENGPDDIKQVRQALTQAPNEDESKKKLTKQELLFALRVVCAATLVLAGGFLLIYRGNDAFQYVKSHAPANMAFNLAKSAKLASRKPAHTKRPRRRSHASAHEATKGGESTSAPAIWKAPKGKEPFQLEVTDSFNQRWRITASGQTMIPVNGPQITQPDVATPTEPEKHPTGATDETEGPTAAAGNSAGPTETSVSDGGPVKPSTIVPPKVRGGENAPFSVVLDALIGADGNVKNVHVVSSPSAALAWAVVEAVKQWHYPPFYRQGHPAEVVTRITVAFRGSPPKQ